MLELPTSTTILLVPSTSPTTSTVRHGPCSARLRSDLGHTQAKYYLQSNIFTHSIYFVDLFYMPWLLFRSLPLDMLGGLDMPTRRSPDLGVQIFYLVLCSLPPRHARGLGQCNLRVAIPVGFYFSCVFLL
jgi:hypothetical protein